MAMERIARALELLSTIVVVVAGGVFLWSSLNRSPVSSGPQQVQRVSGVHIDREQITHTYGSGQVAIVEFSDCQCPFCRRFALETLPTIKRELVEPGIAMFVSLHFPIESLHSMALAASEAAECAGQQGRYWEMRDELFRNADALSTDRLATYAHNVGVDPGIFHGCISQRQTLEKVKADQAEAKRLGIVGTPSFFIGTVRDDGGIELASLIRGSAPLETFRSEIATVRATTARAAGSSQ